MYVPTTLVKINEEVRESSDAQHGYFSRFLDWEAYTLLFSRLKCVYKGSGGKNMVVLKMIMAKVGDYYS